MGPFAGVADGAVPDMPVRSVRGSVRLFSPQGTEETGSLTELMMARLSPACRTCGAQANRMSPALLRAEAAR